MSSKRTLAALAFSWACLSSPSPSWAVRYSAEYDTAIQSAAGRWLPAYPSWKRGKAQLIQESGLRPGVCSAVGACGLGQFMPATWAETARALGLPENLSARFDPKLSIEAWAYYQGRLYNQWKAERPVEDRISFAESSYNAGLGWILRAQRLCNGAALWADVVPKCLPAVTGEHANETINYTLRIRRIWRTLELE